MQSTRCLHMHDPREPHLNVAKHILQYLQALSTTTVFFITFLHLSSSSKLTLTGRVCPDTRRSIWAT
jgi:hypothetical protein